MQSVTLEEASEVRSIHSRAPSRSGEVAVARFHGRFEITDFELCFGFSEAHAKSEHFLW